MIAKYRCWNCRHEWETKIGPSVSYIQRDTYGEVRSTFMQPNPHSGRCPKCGNLYFDWINYKCPQTRLTPLAYKTPRQRGGRHDTWRGASRR